MNCAEAIAKAMTVPHPVTLVCRQSSRLIMSAIRLSGSQPTHAARKLPRIRRANGALFPATTASAFMASNEKEISHARVSWQIH